MPACLSPKTSVFLALEKKGSGRSHFLDSETGRESEDCPQHPDSGLRLSHPNKTIPLHA